MTRAPHVAHAPLAQESDHVVRADARTRAGDHVRRSCLVDRVLRDVV
jgi:hypothetical protein